MVSQKFTSDFKALLQTDKPTAKIAGKTMTSLFACILSWLKSIKSVKLTNYYAPAGKKGIFMHIKSSTTAICVSFQFMSSINLHLTGFPKGENIGGNMSILFTCQIPSCCLTNTVIALTGEAATVNNKKQMKTKTANIPQKEHDGTLENQILQKSQK